MMSLARKGAKLKHLHTIAKMAQEYRESVRIV